MLIGLVCLFPLVLTALTYRPLGGYRYVPLETLRERCEKALREDVVFRSQDLFLSETRYAGPTRSGAPGNRASSVRYRLQLPGRVLEGRCLSEPPGVVLEDLQPFQGEWFLPLP